MSQVKDGHIANNNNNKRSMKHVVTYKIFCLVCASHNLLLLHTLGCDYSNNVQLLYVWLL